jgi:phage gp29-like protein
LGLQPEDYVAGPKADDTDNTKQVWEFGKVVNGQATYMKLRVVQQAGRQGIFHALVWSFHPADYPMKHPPLQGGEL